MSDQITIYHNPRCSKSRQTLALLQQRGIEPQVIEYLKTPPSAKELARLGQLLGLSPRQFIRSGEAPYSELGLNDEQLTDSALLEAMAQHPILIQRPIVVAGDKAAIGRPPEAVNDILSP